MRKVIIIRFRGGLGNQIFQYALYKQLSCSGKEVKADLTFYVNNVDMNRCFQLPNMGLKVKTANIKEIEKFYGAESGYMNIILRKIGLKRHYLREKPYKIVRDIFKYDNIYLDGYWQSEYYFQNIKKKLFEEINWNIKSRRVMYYVNLIKNSISVSIHIRRGDYLNNSIYNNICTVDYYKNAIQYMKKVVEGITFYIFSDDIEWTKKTFCGIEYVFIEGSDNNNCFEDLYLMSLCQYNIIANSSFSWWAAYLNININKIVIAPDKWVNIRNIEGLWCEDWIRLKG
ncbi:Glycosyl transferase family 11 [Lachnospiraceae bacterium NLAE-zl-G231]|nr:Glycosyl transferase family 11 [Lachnospiraceae bacterium NLAE-zl-G231]